MSGAGLDQACCCIAIEVNNRTCTQRDAQLILKIILNALIGQQLEQRQINRMRLDLRAVLNESGDRLWESRYKAFSLVID